MRYAKYAAAACALLAVITFSLVSHADTSSSVAIGAPAPGFSLQDQNGKTINLSDYTGKTVVLEWVNPECPFVKRHYAAKTMITLANDFSEKDVVWLAINSTGTATNATNAAWVAQNSLSYPILNDSAGAVGHLYNAKSTPEMFVIDKTGKLVYSGAIDNDPDGSKADKTNYVRAALDEVLAGKPVSTPQTKSYGCGVHYAH